MRPEAYEPYYHLTEAPFSLTPNPRFLFRSKGHHDVLQAMLYGLETEKGILAIIGEVGTGKTTLCRTLLELLPQKFKTALLLDPHVSVVGLLRSMVERLEIPTERLVYTSLMGSLENYLLQAAERGERPVVILDEAQRLSMAVLEQIRILSNLETPTRKLLQVVLVGQTELEERLLRHELRQLNQRIGVRCYLRPLSRRDTYHYVEHRLRLAGLPGKPPFTRPALRKIWLHSKGIPRMINLISDRALTAGSIVRARKIGSSLVGQVVKSLGGRPRPSPYSVRPSVALAGLLVALMGGGALFWQGRGAEWAGNISLLKSHAAKASAQVKEIAPVLPKPEAETATSMPVTAGTDHEVLLQKLLSFWGIKTTRDREVRAWPVTPDGSPDVRLIAARHGLEAVELNSPPWSDIEAIGMPAILQWDEEAPPRLLIRIEKDSALFLAPDGTAKRRPVEELRQKRPASSWILWRNVDGWTRLSTMEWTGRMVTLFAARLNGLGYLDYPLPSIYDDRFTEAVRRFQHGVGLLADGVLGPRTAMALARASGREGIPQLNDGGIQGSAVQRLGHKGHEEAKLKIMRSITN
jgi:general secretion pathway protein A